MFRANFCPSSGAQDLDFLQHMVQYPVMWYAGVSERVVWQINKNKSVKLLLLHLVGVPYLLYLQRND
jgi:hypothetical protein